MIQQTLLYCQLGSDVVHVSSLSTEESIQSVCPVCQIPVESRIEIVNKLHFVHKFDHNVCAGHPETYAHRIAKKIILNKGFIFVQKEGAEALKIIRFISLVTEKRMSNFIPDIYGLDENEKEIIIEIEYNHYSSKDKVEFYSRIGIDALYLFIDGLYGRPDFQDQVLIKAKRQWVSGKQKDNNF